MSIAARILIGSVGMMTAAAILAPPGRADTIDDSFLSALDNAGVTYADPAITTALGESVCPMLVEPGKSFASVASALAGNNGLSPDMAAFFTGIAISMYCPSMVSSLGDGRFLDWVVAPGLYR